MPLYRFVVRAQMRVKEPTRTRQGSLLHADRRRTSEWCLQNAIHSFAQNFALSVYLIPNILVIIEVK